MVSCKNKGFWHQEVCTNQPHPLAFWYKRSLNPNTGKMVLWDTGPLSSRSAGFPNRVTIPCPNTSLDVLACHSASSVSLDLVTITWQNSCEIFFFFFWPQCTACRVLVSQPESEPTPPAMEARSPNHWTAREVPGPFILFERY